MVLHSPILIDKEEESNKLSEQEGNWFTVEERYCNPPWENLIIDWTARLNKKSPLKISNIEAGEFKYDDYGELLGLDSSKGYIENTVLYDFFVSLCTIFDKELLAIYHPVQLDVLIKTLGQETAVALITEGRVSWGSFQFFYTPNRNLTIKYFKKTIKIQPLYDWFSPASYQETLDSAEKRGYGKGLTAFRTLAVVLFNEIKNASKSAPHSVASATAITDIYLDGPLRKLDRSKINTEVYEFAYNSFHAPWLEMIKTGTFKNLIEYDLNSAYPTEVAELLDITPEGGDWKFYKIGESEDPLRGPLKDAEYGFFYAYIYIRENTKISPIFCRKGQKLFTAVGTWLGMLTLEEIRFIEEFDLGWVHLVTGWYFIPTRILKPFKRDINKYLSLRKEAKKDNRDLLELVIKASTVRFVGKFLQKTFPPLGGSLAEASPAFNSIYANIVMTRVKLKVARLAMLKPDAVANIIVDGLACTETLNIPKNFKTKYGIEVKSKVIPNALLINPQLLYFTKPEREILQAVLREDPTKTWYRIPNKLYMRLCESIVANRFEHIGAVKSDGMTFEVGFDRKRYWPKAPKFGIDLLRYNFDSVPHNAKTLDMMYPYFEDRQLKERLNNMGYYIK